MRRDRPDFTRGALLALDPGVRQGGLAAFHNKVLIAAGPVVSPVISGRGDVAWAAMAKATLETWGDLAGKLGRPDFLVTEQMVVRKPRGAKKKGVRPEDLLEVAYASAWTAGLLGVPATFYKPEDYKRQLPKEVAERRAKNELTAAEKKAVRKCNADLTEDVWDAVYLGLVVLGRV